MQLSFLFVLCGIAIAAAEPYGTNLTFLESKMIGGIDKPNDQVETLMKGAVSIKINGKHKWTGGFYQKTWVFTTANAAMEIDLMLKTPNPECTPEVCYQLNSGREKCIPIIGVAVNKMFLTARKPKNTVFPFDPYDSAILEVDKQHGNDSPTIWNAIEDRDIYIPDAVYYVIGWEFEQDSDRKVVKFMEVEYENHRKCAKSYNMDPAQSPFTIECLKPTKDQNKFKQEDLGAVVIYFNHAIGILSHVDENGKPAIMSRFRTLPILKLTRDWKRNNQLNNYHNALAA